MQFLGKWLVVFIATWAAVYMVPGVYLTDNPWVSMILFSLVLSLINVSIKPILQIIGLPITVITLGIFYLIINALLFMFAGWLTSTIFGVGVVVDGFGAAFLASIVVSIVSTIVSALTGLA